MFSYNVFVSAGVFEVSGIFPVSFGLFSTIILAAMPHRKPIISITIEHTTPVEIAVVIEFGPLTDRILMPAYKGHGEILKFNM